MLGKKPLNTLMGNNYFHYTKKNGRKNVLNIFVFPDWVPDKCIPLVQQCSGYFNEIQIIVCKGKHDQICLLSSIKNPKDTN